MKKKLIISTLALTLALGVSSCGNNDKTEEQGTETTSESTQEGTATETTETTQTTVEGLNTNADDIRALDFYSVEVGAEETSINPFDTLLDKKEFTQLDAPKKGDLVAIIKTNKGEVKVKFIPDIAPKAVKNFVENSLNNYYDGITFHRVIDGFMIQGGDPTATGSGGESIWGTSFVNEINVSAQHFSGTLAMANSGNNVSNGSQFYIVDDLPFSQETIDGLREYAADGSVVVDETLGITVGDIYPEAVVEGYAERGGYPNLNFGYTVFGQVYEGLDVVDTISQVETNENKKPLEDVIIEDITVGIVE